MRSFPAVCYNVVILIRRIIFAAITAFAGSLDGGLTVVLVVTEFILFSLYRVVVKPQSRPTGNRIELISEVLLTYSFFGMMAVLFTTDPK